MRQLFPVFQFIQYWLYKVNEHSLHSPFLYRFYTEVIKPDDKAGFEQLEDLRKTLLSDSNKLQVVELGAGSRIDNGKNRKVADIVRHASTPPSFSRLLNRIITQQQFSTILELGTSLGLNTLYMQQACPYGTIYTLEGSPAIAERAKHHFDEFGASNIHIIEGNIDDTLGLALAKAKQIDLAYLDANHCYEPTLRYFESILPKLHHQSIVVIDDIHWSKEMNKAWKELIKHPGVSLSVDLFEGGLLFFDREIKKEHYVLSFKR
ncbi:MAG: SAM-dependent methyltransferase [Roseivirga sp.]|nr:SAM-dependent methyltransferase [Roseivirga sp.]